MPRATEGARAEENRIKSTLKDNFYWRVALLARTTGSICPAHVEVTILVVMSDILLAKTVDEWTEDMCNLASRVKRLWPTSQKRSISREATVAIRDYVQRFMEQTSRAMANSRQLPDPDPRNTDKTPTLFRALHLTAHNWLGVHLDEFRLIKS